MLRTISGILLTLLIILVPYLWVSYAVDPEARSNLAKRLKGR